MRLRLHPEAYAEGLGAKEWIRHDDPDQGKLFAATLEQCFRKIRESPLFFRRFDGECRKAKVGKFRYSVIYRVRNGEVQVFAIMHHHRRPGYWKDRLDP